MGNFPRLYCHIASAKITPPSISHMSVCTHARQDRCYYRCKRYPTSGPSKSRHPNVPLALVSEMLFLVGNRRQGLSGCHATYHHRSQHGKTIAANTAKKALCAHATGTTNSRSQRTTLQQTFAQHYVIYSQNKITQHSYVTRILVYYRMCAIGMELFLHRGHKMLPHMAANTVMADELSQSEWHAVVKSGCYKRQ